MTTKYSLKLPEIAAKIPESVSAQNEEDKNGAQISRFIAEGDRRPSNTRDKPVPKNYRLQPVFIDIMQECAEKTGLKQTDILKAALAAFEKLDANEQNFWILESKKM
ncbi:stability/ partitioning determinant [Salmonella enterica]|nr:stability/ partitioning determinant [Salmonella enterica]